MKQPGCCDCGAPPDYREEKAVILYAPWWNFPTDDPTGMLRYLRTTNISINATGSRTTIIDHDPDNGSTSTTVIDTPGYVHGPPFTGGSFARSVEYTFDDFIARWKPRFEAMVPLTTFNEPLTITARPTGGGSETDYIIEWWSVATNGGVDAAPGDTFSHIVLEPKSGYPWDGTYRVRQAEIDPFYFWLLTVYRLGGMPHSSSTITSHFDLADLTGPGLFIATCQAYPLGLGCAASAVEDHDAVCIPIDTSDGSLTADWGLELAPGIYSFNGADFVIHSGSVISGDPVVSGGIGGIYRMREDASLGLLYEQADPCPP